MELDLTDKKIGRLVGAPFWFFSLYTGVPFTDKDLDYLLNTIKKHPSFELISVPLYFEKTKSLESANVKINQIVFYDRFYNDSKCPAGIKRLLRIHLAILRYETETFCPGLLEFRYEYVRKWIDSITDNL